MQMESVFRRFIILFTSIALRFCSEVHRIFATLG